MKAQRSLLILPAIYVAAILLTAVQSGAQPGAIFYRVIAINPVGMAAMWMSNGIVAITAVFLITGTPWWYFVARIGWMSKNRKIARYSSALGCLLLLFTAWVCWAITVPTIKDDLTQGLLTKTAIVQFGLVALLGLGALVSAVYSAIASFSPRESTSQTSLP